MKRPFNPQRKQQQIAHFLAHLYPQQSEHQSHFLQAILGNTTAPALLELHPMQAAYPSLPRLSWQPPYVHRLVDPLSRPSTVQDYQQGNLYPLDFSSFLMASPLLALPPQPYILDVCSAPGGKALCAHMICQPNTLHCNEVEPRRLTVLQENLNRCAVPALCTPHTSRQLAERYAQVASLLIVDAPCSGQSLTGKGMIAAGAFHSHTIQLNASRQKRILRDVLPCLQPGGHLLYTTCTFSKAENEAVIEWLIKRHSFTAISIPFLDPYTSTLSSHACYRFEPQQGIGCGGFSCLLRRVEGVYQQHGTP
jgi:16S rRNA C967 or C1407 C5-methylase (RsmB/RsmF family)